MQSMKCRIENVIQTLDLEVMIDDEFFENYRGTGMCVCTQAGSTAYNRSLKGAVIDEGLNLLQLHEITRYPSQPLSFIRCTSDTE